MNVEHDHVRLLAGYASNGKPSYELTPALSLGAGEYKVVGTPGLANGCAAGDRILVEKSGAFVVLERGENVAVHFYSATGMPEKVLLQLRAEFDRLGATTEWPAQRRFAVVTVPAAAGFPAIERIVESWLVGQPETDWNYGNVYDDAGEPLGWWT